MLPLTRRIAALALVCLFSSGGLGLCAWKAAPEARMACCAGGGCSMHASADADSGSARAVSQAEADGCCAASDRGDSTPTAAPFVPVIALGPSLAPMSAPALPTIVRVDAGRAPVPLPGSQVPKHLLLSVFLL